MDRIESKPLLGKVLIGGKLICETGLHIGGSKDNLDIGGLDAPVIRDPLTRQPYIPGSSLKGKLRALFERKEDKEFNRDGGQDVRRHECNNPTCKVCRVFGATAEGGQGGNLPARIIVRDSHLTTESLDKLKQIDTGLQYTEWKFENSLDRVTAAANPRQLERVPKGAEFEFEIVYNVETRNQDELKEDLTNILETLNLLEDDFLGGHGSRGYGRVRFGIETFTSREVAYYGAVSEGERAKYCKTPSVKNVAECKGRMDEVLSLFTRDKEEVDVS